MQTARRVSIARSTHASRLPKEVLSAKATQKSISVAAVFKAQKRKHAPHSASAGSLQALEFNNEANETIKAVSAYRKAQGLLKIMSSDTRAAFADVGVQKPRNVKSSSIARSPQKPATTFKGQKTNVHPYSEEFKETTEYYRNHVYNRVFTKIETTHASLLAGLNNFTKQPLLSTTSPKPTDTLLIHARIAHMKDEIYISPGSYRLSFTHTNEDGEEFQLKTTLVDRFSDYAAQLERDKRELKNLQVQWEQVVGEIWALGMQALGQDIMSECLTTHPTRSSSPSKPPSEIAMLGLGADDNELPSVCDQPPQKKKKSVSFALDDMLPKFLTRASVSKPVPSVPEFPAQEVRRLDAVIGELGAEEMARIGKAEKEYKAAYDKKLKAIAVVLQSD